MRQKYFFSLGDGGFHRVAYTEWGDHDNPHVVVCVHGLARNSRDFDFLAEGLAPDCRVVCMDVVAFIPWGALIRMKGSITRGLRFSNLQEVEAYVRKVCASFGSLSDEQWKQLAVHSVAQEEKGDYVLRYDPAIGEGYHGNIDSEMPIGPNVLRGVDLWNIWGRLKCPTLVLRGAKSEVLVASTLKEMRERRPDTVSVEFEGVGHVPALMSEDQIAPVRQFLLQQ